MKCPIRYEAEFDLEGDTVKVQANCLTSDCAWWIQDINMCSVRDIAIELGTLQHRVAELPKEPHL